MALRLHQEPCCALFDSIQICNPNFSAPALCIECCFCQSGRPTTWFVTIHSSLSHAADTARILLCYQEPHQNQNDSHKHTVEIPMVEGYSHSSILFCRLLRLHIPSSLHSHPDTYRHPVWMLPLAQLLLFNVTPGAGTHRLGSFLHSNLTGWFGYRSLEQASVEPVGGGRRTISVVVEATQMWAVSTDIDRLGMSDLPHWADHIQ